MKKFGLFTCAGVAVVFFSIPAMSFAQSAPGASTDQSQIATAVVYPAPPAGFDPLAASDAALEVYGFPPRPDPEAAPQAYTHWRRLVSTPQTRISNPELTQTAIHHGPARIQSAIPAAGNNAVATSSNWSGYAVTGVSGTFQVNNSAVYGEFVVPIAQQAFGTCTTTWWYSSQWVGFDGYGSSDVLQAGTEADAYCSGGVTSPYYSAWYEWAPNSEVRIGGFAVNPGDLMFVDVWYTTASPYGHAMILNYTTQKSTSIGFNPPAGTTFSGNSAEWVVERPTISGALADLTNYVADQFNIDYAYVPTGSKFYYPGSSPSGTTIYQITMTCPTWSPSSSCSATTSISTPSLYGLYTLWFYNAGPSY
jgi:hypothetical protein